MNMAIEKRYCINCNKFRKVANPKMSYISNKALVLSIICSKFSNNEERIFKEEEKYQKSFEFDLIGFHAHLINVAYKKIN